MSQEHRNAREEQTNADDLPATQGQVNELKTQLAELTQLLKK